MVEVNFIIGRSPRRTSLYTIPKEGYDSHVTRFVPIPYTSISAPYLLFLYIYYYHIIILSYYYLYIYIIYLY
jgi:hypothetical protein